ncbi:RdgB/HAM1 family non-canonical purine NTP pyrophosphatase [Kineococcus sp. NUM-3379]
MSARLVLATRNAHKVAELRAILGSSLPGVEVLGVDAFDGDPQRAVGEVVESGVTFSENALLKARAVASATGLPAVADDSGLCVDVMGGAPGIFSARWCGRHGDDAANLRLLLDQLADVPAGHRGAHFACAAALVVPGRAEVVEVGRLSGTLLGAPRGEGGFGYDPVLVPDSESAPGGRGRTCAELSPQEKNAISHRGAAFRALAPVVARALA